MKAIIVTTASMIVNIHIMENKLTSIYNVKTQKESSMQANQHTTETVGSKLALSGTTQSQ